VTNRHAERVPAVRLWGTNQAPDLWGFCGAATNSPANTPSTNLEPIGGATTQRTVGPA